MCDSAPGLPELQEDERLDRVNEQICLIQKKRGLTFGTDAFLLAAFIKRAPRAKAVELGGGTGIISLLLASKRKAQEITAIEVQPAFSELIDRNAKLNRLDSVVKTLCMDLREVTAEALNGEVDLVFSNPPYMRTDSGKRNTEDQKYIARHEVCGTVFDFCAAAGRLLRYGGKFVCVWRPDRLSELMDAMQRARLEPKRMTMVHADLSAEPCMVLIECIKGAAPSLRISPPLVLYQPRSTEDKQRTLTPEAQKIYDTCSFLNEDA